MHQNGISNHLPKTLNPNLPPLLTSFIGRNREMKEIMRLLMSSRLITLLGTGGCGKTRLALRIANSLSQEYADGVHWMELARLTDPTLILPTLARELDITEQPGQPLLDTLLETLYPKQLLLLLDNCEHLLSGCTQLVEHLLILPNLQILTTSREALSVAGEIRYPVSPLPLPSSKLPVDELAQYDAIQLFVERAQAIMPHFGLNPQNGQVVAEICQRLDGIPLAIELASARVNVLTVEQIATRLDNQFALLSPAPQLTHSQHRTLRATIEWSYNLLPLTEQIIWRRLSIFVGGFSLATAEAVCAGNGVERAQVLELLSSLVNKSLVVAETLQGREARYHLLEMVRQYLQEQLIASADWEAINDQYLGCFLQLTEETAPKLLGQHQQGWFDWLETEYANIRVALAWACEQKRIEAGLRIAIALYQFWDRRSYMGEGFSWFERLNQHLDANIPLEVRINGLTFASFLAMFLNKITSATEWSEMAINLCEKAGEEGKPLLSLALGGAVGVARLQGDAQTAFAISERIIELDQKSPDNLMFGMQLYIHGYLAIVLGKYEVARTKLEEALQYAHEGEDRYRIAIILSAMGDLARCEQRFAQAITFYEQSLALFRELATVRDIPNSERGLAYALLHQGELLRAHTFFSQSMEGQRVQDNRLGILQSLQGFAALAAVSGLAVGYARLHGFVVREFAKINVMATPDSQADKFDYHHFTASIHSQLSPAEFEAEQAYGRTFSLQQAIEYALNLSLPNSIAASKATSPSQILTERECEVVSLVATGLANSEIANQLVLSKRTVEKHIANILAKLDFTSRAQIVRWAIENNLVGSKL